MNTADGLDLPEFLEFLDTVDMIETDECIRHPASLSLEVEPLQRYSPKLRRRSRRVGPLPYSTYLQRRKTAEIQALRYEVQELTAKLEQVQRVYGRCANLVPSLPQQASELSRGWKSMAVTARAEKDWAERTNRKLRDALSAQLKLMGSIRNLLGMMATLEKQDFVLHTNPTADNVISPQNVTDVLLARLTSCLDALHLEAEAMVPAFDDNVIVARSVQDSCLESRGGCIRMKSVTPVASSMRETGAVLWSFATNSNTDLDSFFRFVRKTGTSAAEMNGVAELYDGFLAINAVNVFRRYEERDRIIIVGATLWYFPTTGIQLEDRSWTVISPSPTDPLHASVSRNCYQLKTSSTTTLPTTQVEAVALRTITKTLSSISHLSQKALLRVKS